MAKMLTDKTCLITGGGTGIGQATARRLAEEGAQVWITGRSRDTLQQTTESIGSACTPYVCDVTDSKGVEAMIAEMPALDVLVSNAAICLPVDALSDPIDRWREIIETNMWGTIHTCRAAAQKMISQGQGGRIIIVSSILAELVEVGNTPYGMAKAAINQLARQLASEWAKHNILVNVVAPGYVETPMSSAGGYNELESDWFKSLFLDPDRPRIPLLRHGEPKEIAEAVLFFANPRNSYCTGTVLPIDGGISITL